MTRDVHLSLFFSQLGYVLLLLASFRYICPAFFDVSVLADQYNSVC